MHDHNTGNSCCQDEEHPKELTEEQKAQNRKAFAEKAKLTMGMSSVVSKIPVRIAVWSAKGGVGKTTCAIALARALSEKVATGLLDADIDCPNVMTALGIKERLKAKDGKMLPVKHDALSVISMAAITDEPVIWRGPMITHAISQFLGQTHWEVEALVVDMPPGTSDAALTVSEQLKPTGYVVVTTSQALALQDAKKTIQFLQKMRLPIVGILENMAGEVFGSGGAEQLSNLMGVTFLGSIPLDRSLAQDQVVASHISKKFESVAQRILKNR